MSENQTPDLPSSKYKVILADPPWLYYGDPLKDQAAGKHYSLMSQSELKRIPVRSIAEQRAALFLWATRPRLPEAIDLMGAWGFHYRGVAYVWVKTTTSGKIISGQGVRPTFVKPTTEFLLVGSTCKVGRPLPILTESQGQVVLAARPNNKHSSKPAEFRHRIEQLVGDVPRIELFAREAASGWDSWGLEAPATVEQE